MKQFILILILSTSHVAISQLKLNGSFSAQQLISNKLIGKGIVVSNVVFRGDQRQKGFFDGTNSNIGIDSGIVLSTGLIRESIGPNNFPNSGTRLHTGIKDLDLELISNTGSTSGTYDSSYDAASLEFDFTSQSDSVFFNFVFASEEYLEFVNLNVNDGFGFFLSGPGISGPYTNNAINLAKIPGTNTSISINNLNNNANSSYYIDNGNGFSAPQNTDTTVVQFDGFTKKIELKAAIQCNQTYHIKMVICDIGDAAYNSAVFIEGKTFQSNRKTPRLTVVQNKDTICLGDSITLNLNTHSIRVKSISPNTIPQTTGVYVLKPKVSTTYELIFEDTTVCGLIFQDTNTINVYIRPSLNIAFTPDSVCLGDTAQLINSSIGFFRNALWDFKDGKSSTSLSTIVSHLYSVAGNYPVQLKLTTSKFCIDSIQKNVLVYERPTLNFLNQNGCQFDSLIFSNTSIIPPIISTNITWKWDYGTGINSSGFNGKSSFSNSGLQTISLISTTDDGCVDSIKKTIVVNPKPTADFKADTICFEHETRFTDFSTGNIASWEWKPNLGNQQNYSHLFDSHGSHLISLSVITDSGCIDEIEKTIIVRPKPTAAFTVSPNIINIFDTEVCFTNNSLDATHYFWNFGFNGINSTSTLIAPCGILYPDKKADIYNTKLYAMNEFGCIDSISKQIEIEGSYILYIPNAFSPNYDGLNDRMDIFAEGLIEFNMKIFNRWGELLFESNNPKNFWDGTHNGTVVPIGSYPYSIKVKDLLGNVRSSYHFVQVIN